MNEQTIDDFLNDLSKRREECELKGHADEHWFFHNAFNRYGPIEGICNYCLSPIERSLNSEEQMAVERAIKSQYAPFTI